MVEFPSEPFSGQNSGGRKDDKREELRQVQVLHLRTPELRQIIMPRQPLS